MKTRRSLFLILLLGVSLGAQTVGIPSNQSAIAQTVLNVKPTAGEVVGWNFTNTGNATCYVQFFNALPANVSLGTTTPFMSIPIQTTNVNLFMTAFRIQFNTAISIASATTATGNSACNANPAGVIFYH